MLAAVALDLVERGVDLARIHVLAADGEHVVDAAEDSVWQARISPPARVRLVGPLREIAGDQPDHGLGGALELRIDGRAALAVRHAVEVGRIADLGIDDVLPAKHPGRLFRATHVHPGRDLRHRAGVVDLAVVGLLDPVLDAGYRRSRLAGEEQPPDPEILRIDALLLRHLREVERERGRPVERLRLHRVHPLHRPRRHPRRAGPERERLAAQPLGTRKRTPAPHVEAEDGGDEDHVAGTDAHAVHDPRVRVGDVAPVVTADGEGGGTAGRAGGAVHVEDLRLGNAEIVAEGLHPLLRLAQIGLGDHRALRLEVLQRPDLIRVKARLIPLLLVERRLLVRVAAELLQALHDGALAVARGHRLARREPVPAARFRAVRIVVARRPRPVFHLGHCRPRLVIARRARGRDGAPYRRSRSGAYPGEGSRRPPTSSARLRPRRGSRRLRGG